jgi:hypothetical protein
LIIHLLLYDVLWSVPLLKSCRRDVNPNGQRQSIICDPREHT